MKEFEDFVAGLALVDEGAYPRRMKLLFFRSFQFFHAITTLRTTATLSVNSADRSMVASRKNTRKMSLNAVFSHLLEASSSLTLPTQSSIFIQNYTLCLRLVQGDNVTSRFQPLPDIAQTFPTLKLHQRRLWDSIRAIINREIKARKGNVIIHEWIELDDLYAILCQDIVSDGLVTVYKKDLELINGELKDLLHVCLQLAISRLTTRVDSSSTTSSRSSSISASQDSRRVQEESSAKTSQQISSSDWSQDILEGESSGGSDDRSARSSLLSSDIVLTFTSKSKTMSDSSKILSREQSLAGV